MRKEKKEEVPRRTVWNNNEVFGELLSPPNPFSNCICSGACTHSYTTCVGSENYILFLVSFYPQTTSAAGMKVLDFDKPRENVQTTAGEVVRNTKECNVTYKPTVDRFLTNDLPHPSGFCHNDSYWDCE